MPSRQDKTPLQSAFLKRSAKLLPCQKERIFKMHNNENYGIKQLARMFKVNKRSIQFICYPERAERNRQLREDRGGSKKYYNREKHTEAIKSLRDYKNQIFNT